MNKTIALTALVSGALLLMGAGKAAAPTVHESMKQVIAPQTQAIWDITNRAVTDDGAPDPAKISTADWSRLAMAAEQLKASSSHLATAARPVAAKPGQKLQDEGSSGGAGAREVQGYIDADRQAFSGHAAKLADAADTMVKAAKAKNPGPLFEVAGNLDQLCESCHVQFWYPKQAQPK